MQKTHCNKGIHPWTDENIKIDPRTGNRRCLACKKEYQAKYRKANQQKIRKYQQKHYQEHKEEKKAYYQANRKKKIEASRKRREEKKEQLQEYDRQYHLKNREKKLRYLRNWKKLNPTYQQDWNKKNRDKKQAIDKKADHKRRALKRKALGHVSPDIEEVLWEKQKGICKYCPRSLDGSGFHLEHMIPLSRGGFHDDANLCLSCPECNWRKNTMTAEEFKRRKQNAATSKN